MRGVFITGTGTAVGKTVIAAGVLRMLRSAGINAAPMKPVQTGCIRAPGGDLVASDLDFALQSAGMQPNRNQMELMAPYRFEPACSPHFAAALAGVNIKIIKIVGCAADLSADHEFIVAEGAGGVLVPLNETETIMDLIKALKFSVMIVADAGLGTINHTLLTVAVLRQSGIEIAGVVINSRDCSGDALSSRIADDNAREIERKGRVPVLGRIAPMAAFDVYRWTLFEKQSPGLSAWIASVPATGARV